MKSTYTEAAERKASTESNARLAASLASYADDIESEGRTYAPAYMREAARRLAQAEQPAPTDAYVPKVGDRVRDVSVGTVVRISPRLGPIVAFDGQPVQTACEPATLVLVVETVPQGAPPGQLKVNGHVFEPHAPLNCDKCGLQFGARFTRACEVTK